MGIKILGSAKVLPQRQVDNSFFASYLDTSDEWIKKRTGISSRCFFEVDEWEDSIVKAAKLAVEKQDKSKIKLVAFVSMSTLDKMPVVSAKIHQSLNLVEEVMVFDLNVACTGFVTALSLVEGYLNEGEMALIIGAEKLSNLIDFQDRATAILFGDGVGAVLIEKNNQPTYKVFGTRFNEEALSAKEEFNNHIKMEGQSVFRFATEQVTKTVLDLVAKSPYTLDEIDHFVFHQANKRIIEYVAKKLAVNPGKFHQNLEHHGNTSSASIPMLLDDLIKTDALKNGEKVMLIGFGGGLTWGGILFEW